jgi:hypothetical protein
MFAVRRRVSWMVAIWLACQVAGVVAAPLAFCCQPAAAPHDDEKCCPGLLPGQICPMHHKREGDRTCKMRDVCERADAALVSLVGVVGLLQRPTVTVSVFDIGAAIAPSVPSAIARAHRPESPPPRA